MYPISNTRNLKDFSPDLSISRNLDAFIPPFSIFIKILINHFLIRGTEAFFRQHSVNSHVNCFFRSEYFIIQEKNYGQIQVSFLLKSENSLKSVHSASLSSDPSLEELISNSESELSTSSSSSSSPSMFHADLTVDGFNRFQHSMKMSAASDFVEPR